MKVKALTIKSFRNLKNLKYNFSDINVFKGKNALGKSTIIDAIMWMLTDNTYVYLNDNKRNLDTNNIKDPIEVTMTIETYDKESEEVVEYELNRKYYAYYKLDTNGEEVFSLYRNEFKINGTKHAIKKYLEAVRNMVGVGDSVKGFDELQFLYDTNYLDKINYAVVRAYIMSLITMPSDKELLAPAKYDLIRSDILTKSKLDNCDGLDTLNVLNAKYNTAFKEADENLTVKKVQQESLNFEDYDKEKIEKIKLEIEKNLVSVANVKEEETKIEELNKELLEKTNAFNEKVKIDTLELQKISNKGSEYNNQHRFLQYKIQELNNKIETAKKQIEVDKANAKELKAEVSKAKEYLKEMNSKKESIDTSDLEKELEKVGQEKFVGELCPNCGCELNEELAKRKKSEELLKIKSMIDIENSKYDKEITACSRKISSLENDINSYKARITKYQDNLETLKQEIVDETVKKDELSSLLDNARKEYSSLELKIGSQDKGFDEKAIKGAIESLKKQKEQKQEAFKKHKLEINEKLSLDYEVEKAYENDYKLNKKLIEEIKELNIQKINALKSKELTKAYKKDKQQAIEEAVGQVFGTVHFVLQKENETGTIVDCCTPVLNGVDFSGLNSGQKYITGLEVIESVRKAKGYADFPIFIDRIKDLDNENIELLEGLTNSQIFFSEVTDDKKIKLETKERVVK